MNNTDILILFILAGLSFSLAFGLSAPSLYLTDEWITVNQLNQISSGSQLIETQGKYGELFTGETSLYFTKRGNYLAYSLMLPILSLPIMNIILATGDSFRLIFIFFFFIVGSLSFICSIKLSTIYKKKRINQLSWAALFLFFFLTLINLYYYQPFSASYLDSPIESAAIIFTNEMLFACIAPMIYLTFKNLSMDKKTSLLGAFSIICCSTYLFWSASAKDHLLIAVLLTGIFYIFSSLVYKETDLKWFLLFLLSGLVCWARPEYGSIIILGLFVWKLMTHLIAMRSTHYSLLPGKKIRTSLFSALGLLSGLIPFFINNKIITGNPIIPPQYLYIISDRGTQQIDSITNNMSGNQINSGFSNFFGETISFFLPDINNLFVDLSGILLLPENGAVGILFICPIILPAILYGLLHVRSIKENLHERMKMMILFSLFIIFITIFAYLRVIHGSTISEGVMPDMRYLSPLYLPLGIISILLLSPLIKELPARWLKYSFGIVILGAPLLVIGTTITLVYGVQYSMYISFFMKILIALLILFFSMAAFKKGFWSQKRLISLFFASFLLIPASFQFLLLLIYSYGKINGYYFWLPVLQYLFTYVFRLIS